MGQSLVESAVGAATTAMVINTGLGKENTRHAEPPNSIADLELIKTIGKGNLLSGTGERCNACWHNQSHSLSCNIHGGIQIYK